MISLIFTACLIENPVQCRDETISAEVTLWECMISSQSVLAQWAVEHPAYRITKYKCGRPEASL